MKNLCSLYYKVILNFVVMHRFTIDIYVWCTTRVYSVTSLLLYRTQWTGLISVCVNTKHCYDAWRVTWCDALLSRDLYKLRIHDSRLWQAYWDIFYFYISDHMQSTFFCLGKFLKKLADDQSSSITKKSLRQYLLYQTYFSMEVNWQEIWL